MGAAHAEYCGDLLGVEVFARVRAQSIEVGSGDGVVFVGVVARLGEPGQSTVEPVFLPT